ncbi:MAG: zinc ribbon domain-containing protein [Anaerolineales bacterium]|nr:zinc ribbon domain-containing protein [Anaerolineales bacterium]MBK8823480.1 zinc ribbon domain-containing protein [Anaerolineales bacterium]
MELGTIFLILAVIVIVGIYLYAPFTTRARRNRVNESHEVSALKAERDRVINSLQELDFDFNLGKIPAGEYPDQRAALLQKGADILRKLDELAPVSSSALNAEARIEKATAAGRADAATSRPLADNDDDLESMISARRKQHKSKSAGFCPKCGKPVLISDKFCPACGKSLN